MIAPSPNLDAVDARVDEVARNPYVFRQADARDVADVARLHRASIDRGFMASLGEGFLRRLYAGMAACPHAAVFVCVDGDRIVGFSAVTVDTRAMFRWIALRRVFRVGAPLLLRLTRPARIRQAWENVRYPGRRVSVDLPAAELLSVGVDPDYRRRGLGRGLVQIRLAWLMQRGIERVQVTCTQGLASNPMYQALGFALAGTVEHHGRVACVYTATLTAPSSDPVNCGADKSGILKLPVRARAAMMLPGAVSSESLKSSKHSTVGGSIEARDLLDTVVGRGMDHGHACAAVGVRPGSTSARRRNTIRRGGADHASLLEEPGPES